MKRSKLFKVTRSLRLWVAAKHLLWGFLFAAAAFAGTTAVVFNPQSVSGGPFPTNALTKPSWFTGTGLQINLEGAGEDVCDPKGHASVCSNAGLLNTLDGFSVNPRVMACFSGPIDPKTIASGLHIVPLQSPSTSIGVTQIVYDHRATSYCVYGKPDRVLDQQTSYLLLVTTDLHDEGGNSVKDDGGYRACLKGDNRYCESLADAISKISSGVSNDKIVSASLFTTMSATSWLEDAHLAGYFFPAELLPAGPQSTFDLSQVSSLTWQPDVAAQPGVPAINIPLNVLSGVGRISFGLFLSPNYLNTSGAAAGTITGSPFVPVPVPGLSGAPPGFVPVSFHVFVPAGTPPPGGWPVVIYGHGLGDNQFGAPTFMASTLALHGFATIAMEITGHGFGPNSTVTVTPKGGNSTTVATPGRGLLIPGNTSIGPEDGCIVPGALAIRDCGRQTAVDLFALVKTMRWTEGLGLGLSDDRIFYVGQSFGSIYGSLFHAVEPAVQAALINSGGGTFTDIARLALTGRPLAGAYLASLGLLNVPLAHPERYFESCPGDCFNDEYPFRGRPPLTNGIPGAIEIQAAFEAADWLGMVGDPLAFGPHFKTSPLFGVPPKATLFQFGLGDLEVPNPTESALVRAADGQDTAWYFRFDLAVHHFNDLLGLESNTPFPILPHRILSNLSVFINEDETSISLAEQKQAALFFASDGRRIVDPNTLLLPPASPSWGLFEQPTTLPEHLNFLQIPPE